MLSVRGWLVSWACVMIAAFLVFPLNVFAQEPPLEEFQEAIGLFEQGLYEEARAAFQVILRDYDNPENRAKIEFDPIIGGSLYHLGELCFQEENYLEGISFYGQVLDSFQSYRPESKYHLGMAKYYLQDYLGAISIFQEQVAQYAGSPLVPQALYYQGVCFELLKDSAQAKAIYQEMIRSYPSHPWSKKAIEKVGE